MTDLEARLKQLLKTNQDLSREIAARETELEQLRVDLKRNGDDIAEVKRNIERPK